MACVAPTATPRPSAAIGRPRSGSTLSRTNSSVPSAALRPPVGAALPLPPNTTARSTTASAGPSSVLREGYIMFYDTPAAEWQRVFMTLTHATMSMQSTCSRFGRFVRPTSQLADVTHFYCSLDVPDAPDRHIPILGMYAAAKDELFIFRTPERRSLMDWCLHLREACPAAPWMPIEDMSSLRVHFSPQLYGTLFRPDLAAKGIVRTPNAATAATATAAQQRAQQALNRRGALSACCPRRGPMRRGGVAAVVATPTQPQHVDPSSSSSLICNATSLLPNPNATGTNTNNSANTSAHADEPSAVMPTPLQQQHASICSSAQSPQPMPLKSPSQQQQALRGLSVNTNTADQQQQQQQQQQVASAGSSSRAGSSAGSGALCPDEKKRVIEGLRARPSAAVVVRAQPVNVLVVNDENSAPPSTAVPAVVVKNGVPTISLANAVPILSSTITTSSSSKTVSAANSKPASPVRPPAQPPAAHAAPAEGPSAAERLLQAKVKDLRSELDAVSGRNIDLEIDNANISARVLELEAEVATLKDATGEWRRRFQSLEQQLKCQEEGFALKLAGERAELIANMREEVEAQLGALKGRFAERERQLEARIAELTTATNDADTLTNSNNANV